MKKAIIILILISIYTIVFSQEYNNEAGIITHSIFLKKELREGVDNEYFKAEKHYSQGIGFYYNYYFNKKLSLDIYPSYNNSGIEEDKEIHVPIKLSYYINPKNKIIAYSSFGINNIITTNYIGYNIFVGGKYNINKRFVFDCSTTIWLFNFKSEYYKYKELMLNFSIGYKF